MNVPDALTAEVRAMIGVTTARSLLGTVEPEGVRRFSQAIMDPDPRYWDADFAATTPPGVCVAPPLYCAHFNLKRPAGAPDPFEDAFAANPDWDGSSVALGAAAQTLPVLPTPLVRILNGGNEIELLRYPRVGDRVYAQLRYADISGRTDKQGRPLLIVVIESVYTDQNEAVLCRLRQTLLRR